MTKPTPLCDALAGKLDGPIASAHLIEQREYALAFQGEAMMRRLNDFETLNKVIVHASMCATTTQEIGAHIRAYVLSGRVPWGRD